METAGQIETERSPESSLLQWGLRRLVRLLISVIILWALISFLDLSLIIQTFEFADPIYMSLGCILIVGNLGSQIAKWQSLLKVVNADSTWLTAAKSVLFGNSLGSLTPGNLGEFFGRSLTIDHHPFSHIISLAIFDRLQTFAVMTIGFCMALPFFPFWNGLTGWLVSATIIVFVVIALLKSRAFTRWIANRSHFPFNHPLVQKGFEALRLLQPRVLYRTFLYSALFYVIMGVQMFFFLRSFESLALLPAFAGFSATMFAKSLLPISLGDLGIREAASVFSFSLLGISNVAAFNAALMMFVVNILVPALVGVAFVPRIFTRSSSDHTR